MIWSRLFSAVTISTGRPFSDASARIALSRSMPVMLGMFQSVTTRSNGWLRSIAIAFSPSSASWISGLLKPSSTSRFLTMRRMVEKSSTTRIFMFLSNASLHMGRQAAPWFWSVRPRSAAPAGKSCAQPEHRLPVDLAHAGLAHAEHRADLLQVQLLFVVQRHHQLLAFGQAADRLGQVLAHALALDVLRRPEAALVGHVHHAALVAVVRPGEAEQPHAGGIGQHLVVFLGADAQPPHHLLLVRLRTRLDLDLADHLRHLAGLAMDRARRPVGASQLVQHRATDADARIRFEARPAVLGEIARRFQQTDHSRLDQVAHVHAGRQPPHQVIGDPPHQRCMAAYQVVRTFTGNLPILRSHTHLGTPSAVAFRPPKKAIRSNTARSVSAHLSTSSANFLNASAEWLDGHTSTTAHCLRMAWRRRSSCGTHPLKSITTSRKRSLTRASFWCSARASPSLRTMLATMRMRRTPKSRLSTLVRP